MPLDAKWDFNFRGDKVKRQIRAGVFAAVQEVFEVDIKTAAKIDSPVDTGFNRQSIDTEVGEVDGGIKAELFSQSGYGGYLELGTVKMPARPYLYTAFNRFRAKLMGLLKIRIARADPDAVVLKGYEEKAND